MQNEFLLLIFFTIDIESFAIKHKAYRVNPLKIRRTK